MSDIEAALATIKAVNVSDDGEHVILQFDNQGQDINLALPASDAPQLMTLLSQAWPDAQNKKGASNEQKLIFPCEWWNVGTESENEHVVFSFQIPGGMEMSYRVHVDAAQGILQTLQVILGGAMSAPHGTTKQ